MTKKVVTRIPPSPTGNLHVGTARTALFNFLFARQHKGHIIYRSEDTDRTRSTQEFENENKENLEWLGITWDDFSRQSEHTNRYSELLEKLVNEERAYVSHEPAKDDPKKEVSLIRLKNPGTKVTFKDLVRGEITFDTEELGDFVIARSADDPLYHFAVVVDDMDGEVTHVIRGDDHISNTPRQILIQEALGARRPEYAHIPLILASDRSKLSKRKGGAEIAEYRKMGYMPEALINYLALLGWNPGTERELFTLDDLIKSFSIENVQKGGAIFDNTKLNWFNREYLKQIAPSEFSEALEKSLPQSLREKFDEGVYDRFAKHVLNFGEPHTILEIVEAAKNREYDFFFSAPNLNEMQTSLIPKKDPPSTQVVGEYLQHVQTLLKETDDATFTVENIKTALWDYATEQGRGQVLWPLRVALSGKEKSPDPFTVAHIIGKDETLRRIESAVNHLTSA